MQATHISSLPCEVLRLVLHCVVSVHLDMRSLEQCSMVWYTTAMFIAGVDTPF